MPRRIPAITLAVGALVLLAASAPPAGTPGAARYDGHRAVRTYLQSLDEVDQVHAMGGLLLSCLEGAGPVDYAFSPEAMDALEASGIPHDVLHEDLQALIDAERARIDAHAAAGGVAGPNDPWLFDEYRDLDAINAYMQTLVQVDADNAVQFGRVPLTEGVFSLGDSLEGRSINAIRLGAPGTNKPVVIFNGFQHAREWIGPMVNMYIMDRLVRDYDSDPVIGALLDAVDVIIVPVVNPDGYVFSWDALDGDRMWRKNRRGDGNSVWGVDNNRNWGTAWGGGGSSGDPGSQTYRGTAPFSEPETTALRDLFLATPDVFATIDFHSYSQLVLWPWAYQHGQPIDDDGLHAQLGGAMADAIQPVHGRNYTPGPVRDTLYQASGGSVDWTWAEGGAISWTIELRDTGLYGFLLPADQIVPTAEENFAAVTELLGFTAECVTDDPAVDLDGNDLVDACEIAGGDVCGFATLLLGAEHTFFKRIAATEGPGEAGCATFEDDRWFKIYVPSSGTVTVDLCGSTFAGSLAAYHYCPNDPDDLLGCTDDACATPLTFDAPGAGIYRLRLGGGQPDDLVSMSITYPTTCPADTDGSGTVDAVDLLALLAAWGTSEAAFDLAPEAAPDGMVDTQDLLVLLAAWGACP